MDKRENILQAAEKLFVEKGFEGTSVRDLAKEAEVNLAMISYYFGSKEKLFAELVEKNAQYSRTLIEEINNDKGLNSFAKLEKAIDLFVDRIISNRKYHLMLYRELSLEQRQDMHEMIIDILHRNKNELQRLLSDGVKQGHFRADLDVELSIMTIFGVINQCSRDTVVKKLLFNSEEIDHQKLKIRVKKYLKEILSLYLK